MQPTGRAFLTFLLAVAAALCFAIGITKPIIQMTVFYFWEEQHSILEIISSLYSDNEIFLALTILVFSIVLPMLKLIYIAAAATIFQSPGPRHAKLLGLLDALGKWSMLDVLVLALIVFYIKTTTWTDAIALSGAYFFAASVIFTMLAYGLLPKPNAKAQPTPLLQAAANTEHTQHPLPTSPFWTVPARRYYAVSPFKRLAAFFRPISGSKSFNSGP